MFNHYLYLRRAHSSPGVYATRAICGHHFHAGNHGYALGGRRGLVLGWGSVGMRFPSSQTSPSTALGWWGT